MKNFLKQNWLKLSVVIVFLVVAISLSSYFVVFLPKEKTLENLITQQQKCADEALKFFKANESNRQNTDYTNHWNRKLNKCFIEIQTSDISNGSPTNSDQLYDAFEGKQYGWFFIVRDKKRDEQIPTVCEMYSDGNTNSDKSCTNETWYDSFVEPYMNE